jgi:putative transposase
VFTKEILNDLRGIFAAVCHDFEATLVEFDGEDDHVHLLVNYPPKVAVSALVNSLKGVSSRLIRRKKYPEIRKKIWGRALWSQSFLPEAVAALPSKSFANTSNSSRPHTDMDMADTNPPHYPIHKDGSAVRAILPRSEGRGLLRI